MNDAPSDLIPARMLNEVVYCPRLFYLEHVAGEWEDNADTLAGKRVHRRVDASMSSLAPANELPPEDMARARSVTVAAEGEGIIAKLDLVETRAGHVFPVDYKRGSAPSAKHAPAGAWPADRVQIGAQILALREAGYTCTDGVLYYAGSKTRVPIVYDDALLADVRAAVRQARAILATRKMPPPLEDSPKCPGCSLVGVCLPDETRLLQRPRRAAARRVRRLLPANDDRQPCHVQENGATISKRGERLRVQLRDGSTREVRISGTSHLSLYGQVHLTTGAIQGLCSEDVGVSFFSSGAWYYGSLRGISTAAVHTRLAQFRVAARPSHSLALAREFIRGKILNGRTLLRRHLRERGGGSLPRLKGLAAAAAASCSVESLLGIEGAAARLYFESFARLLSPRAGAAATFSFQARNRRPPRDPVNALLSFAYALLLKDVRVALLAAGFDPTVGFLHQPRPGRPALALDLMEEFRPLLADSAVLTAINTSVVQEADLVHAAGAVALSAGARKGFIGVYERRMRQEVKHPLFGYRISYRRVLEVQARLLARTVVGELAAYPSFLTR